MNDDHARRAYTSFVDGIVDDAIADVKAAGLDCTAGNLAEYVSWDSELVDRMIQERIFEVSS